RFLARRTPGAPDTDRRRLAVPERRHDARRQHGVDLPIAEELRDVDGERIEQPIVLRSVGVEDVRVVVVGVNAARAHAHGDPAAQAFLFVARAAEPAVGGDLARELEKISERRRGVDHQYACFTDSMFVRTIAFSGSSASARSQLRTASSRCCRRRRMLPSFRYTSGPSSGLALTAREYASNASS